MSPHTPAPPSGKQKKEQPEWVKKCGQWCACHKLAVIGAVLFLVLLLLFTNEIRMLLAIGILAAAGAFSQVYRRVVRIPPAIELVTFGTVMVGYVYGPWFGALFAFIVGITAEVMSSSLDAFIVSYVPSRVIMGIVAGFLFQVNIVTAGIALTFLYNLLAQPLYLLQPNVETNSKAAFYVAANILFNVVLFRLLAEPVLRVML